ncbi:MAG TPA: TRAP transporter substrate-binding protein [Burkholderiales bacterium]|nr:TRAP transporter substrate-binding protein [Burkholderiales bacterium]
MTPLALKFGGYQEPASIHNRAATRFGELLKERLHDRIAFELIGSILKLGHRSGDLVPMVERGELSFCYMSTVRFSGVAPELKVLELPFVVGDRAAAFRALDGELGESARHQIEERTACRLLGYWDNGFRHLSNRVRPIRGPEDCRGIRIRTQMSELHGETFRALGFEPIAADIREFVRGVGGDEFEAQDNPLTNIYNFGVHQHHRYITLSGHFWGASALVCNAAHYRGWSKDVRDAVDASAREATVYQRRLAAAEDAEILPKLEAAGNEVIRLTDAERAAFLNAVEPVLEKHRKKMDPKLLACLETA